MAQVRFTAGRLDDFNCEAGKRQSFLWDNVSPGLGLRVTASGAKSYIFQAKLNGDTIRITIGDLRTWDIGAAQAEARRLKVIVDGGKDPRKLKADELVAKQAAAAAEKDKQLRDSITLGDVWPEHIADRLATRQKRWSNHHLASHYKMIQAGGAARNRSPKLTKPGPLLSLAAVPLVALTTERIEEWAKTEAKVRPSSARLAWRLLKACMNWCSSHKKYASMVPSNPTKSLKARESLGRPKARNDVLQRNMLRPWFSAVRSIGNPVIGAYLQTLLLTGARREELAALKWTDVDFRWATIKLHDKVNDTRVIPLTPFVAELLSTLPRRNEFVFSSPAAAAGYISEPRYAHNAAVAVAGLPALTLHGLRRSFASLSEWVKMPHGTCQKFCVRGQNS